MNMNIHCKQVQEIFIKLYGNNEEIINYQNERYENLINQFRKKFKQEDINLFSTPGRTEIGGNHTDHNHGKVLAASINLDSIAVASKNSENTVILFSDSYAQPFQVNLDNLKIVENEKGTTNALIRGIAARFIELGYNISGFNACITSDVLQGSGLSSSASIEVLIGTIFNAFYNNYKIKPEVIAAIGQYAENEYFGKPCGLMDQLACAVGGIISIDFLNPKKPKIKKVDFEFSSHNYSLLVVDTKGNHADLTADYAAIPDEMNAIANYFGEGKLRNVGYENFLEQIPSLCLKLGERAVLRAMHFYEENKRVDQQVLALENNDIAKFLYLVMDSGNSSFKWLQNIYSNKDEKQQEISLALALTEQFIKENGSGACRIHGGGFAGTILVLLPKDSVRDYIKFITQFFLPDCVLVLAIRQKGSLQIV